MMRGQYEELPCPFCDKGRIQAWHIPSVYSVKRMHIASSSKPVSHKSPDIWLIKSGCSVCGKSQEEVEKKLRSDNII